MSISHCVISLSNKYAGCPTNNIRLVGSSRANQGRVELCINGRWVTVCDDHWTAVEAGVVCKSLGYLETGKIII